MGLRGKPSLLVEVQAVTEPKESFLPPAQGQIIPQSAWELTEISQARRTSHILAAQFPPSCHTPYSPSPRLSAHFLGPFCPVLPFNLPISEDTLPAQIWNDLPATQMEYLGGKSQLQNSVFTMLLLNKNEGKNKIMYRQLPVFCIKKLWKGAPWLSGGDNRDSSMIFKFPFSSYSFELHTGTMPQYN